MTVVLHILEHAHWRSVKLAVRRDNRLPVVHLRRNTLRMASVSRAGPWGLRIHYYSSIGVCKETVVMAGVFDIDLDQPEDNVSDEELADGVCNR